MPGASMQVYTTPEKARRKIFPAAQRFERQFRLIPAALKAELEKDLGHPFQGDTLEVYMAYGPGDTLLGYALIDEEIGKYRPITFMLGIGPDFRVKAVAVLVYRESRGSQVRRSRFLRQYRGKSGRDPLRLDRDIINITGATLSVRALNFGIRKLLVLTQRLYGPQRLP